MADSTTKPVLSVCATVGSKVSDLSISDGQLIFVRDKRRIALDFDGKRTFYNLIEELATEGARTSMLAPVTGCYYFVVETGVLWTYQGGWVRITTDVEEALAQAKESGEFDGPAGPAGPKGDTGETGAQGPKGDAGDNGYTPVRGTDYWTDADKAEIKSYVDEAILGGAW